MKLLLISDIHANYPALKAVADHFAEPFDLILNGGDTTVYGPFPNETIDWLREHQALSIIGNTDRTVVDLLDGRSFASPRKPDKRIMYGWTAAELSRENGAWLQNQPPSRIITPESLNLPTDALPPIGMYHGSPADPDEFLFAHTKDSRFAELGAKSPCSVITVGHSHSPFHKHVGQTHFINPGSVGRMFDGNPAASCATVEIDDTTVRVELQRISYPVETVIHELERLRMPPIYQDMYRLGKKLN